MTEELHQIWRRGAFAVPEGELGPWKVRRSFITPAQAMENRRQAEVFGETRYSPPGVYTALIRDDEVWMADTPDEMFDHQECFEQAKLRGGRVLIHGLGLGLITRAVLSLENVERVDVVELDASVIALVIPAFKTALANGRLAIHLGDCRTFRWRDDIRWTVVWHDIWQAMVEANLPEMDALERQFHARCDWQGSWGKEWILEQRKRRIESGSPTGSDATAVASYAPE